MNQSPDISSVNRLENAIEYVRDVVAMFRRDKKMKMDQALPKAAELLDIKHHRATSLFYEDKMWHLPASEAERIERNFARYLDREISISIERTEALRVKKRQIEMRLAWKDSSSHGSGYNSTAWPARLAG